MSSPPPDALPGAAPGTEGATDVLDTPSAGPAAIRGSVLRVAGYGVGVLITTASAALLFRHLGVVNAGRYVSVVSLVTIAAGLSDAGLTAISMRQLTVKTGAARAAVIRNVTGVRVVLTIVGGICATAFAAAAGYGRPAVIGTVWASAGILLQSIQHTYTSSLMARLRLGWVTALELLRNAVTAVLIAVLVVAGATLPAFLAIPIPVGVLALALTGVLVRRDIPMRPSFRVREWRELIREVLPYSAATIVTTLHFRMTIIVVSVVASARATGYFGAAYRIVDVIAVVPGLVVGAAFPIFARAARDDRVRLKYALDRAFDTCTIAGGWIALLVGLGAPLAIAVVAGPKFHPSVDILRIQAIGLGISFVGALFGYVWLSLAMYRAALLISVIGLVSIVTLSAGLTAAAGTAGAAVAIVVAELILAIAGAAVLARNHPDLLPRPTVVPRVILGCALAASLAAIPGIPVIVLLVAASTVYLGVLLATRSVPDELLHELRRMVAAAR